jgi:hypothetical protein
MKKIAATLLLLLILAGFTNCKKFVEKKKENALINIMTDGKWVVTSFVMNTVDITDDFQGYAFKYYSNRTVDAIKNGSVQKSGSWDGDVETMTTWAEFLNANEPLVRINGYWHIDDSGLNYVIASQRGAIDAKEMRLDKVP